MSSVINRIKEIKQPRGGYIPPKMFMQTVLGPGEEEIEASELNPGIIGAAVDYLTKFMLGAPATEAFKISDFGAAALYRSKRDKNAMQTSKRLMAGVQGLDNQSIINACKLCGFDVCYRAGTIHYKPVEEIHPDSAAIESIRLMVNRSLVFFEEYGPITLDGPTFRGGYTEIVDVGDGDFLTEDTIWDMKTSKKPPTNKQTLQLLMYYLLGKHSVVEEFKPINKLGIFNPRLNTVYILEANMIDPKIIREVETEVIGYR